jgi:hypothetical protein
MFRSVLLIATVVLIASPSLAQQDIGARKESGDSFMMYGQDHLFALNAPTGWTVDTVTAQKLGVHAVMYPDGSSWRDAAATIYTNFVHKDPNAQTIEKIIADDIAGYKKDSPNITTEDSEPLPLAAGKEKVIVKRFRGDKGGNIETVAYVDENKVVIMIVLSARTEKDFQASLPRFKELVHSYRFISDSVTFNK